MEKPSVLFINRVYPPNRGATGRILRDLARSFAREGWHVTVITTGAKAGQERDGSIRVIRVKGPAKPSGMFGYGWIWIKFLLKAFRQPSRNLLVTMSDPPLLVLAGNIVAGVKKSRHIHWCQDLYPDVLPALGFKFPGFILNFFKSLSRKALKNCDKVIVVGRCMARRLASDGLEPTHITVVPNWPDFELIRTAGINEQNKAVADVEVNGQASGVKPYAQLLKEGAKFRVLYAGNIGKAHPIKTILDAAEKLNTEFPEIEFIFVGDGNRFDDVAKQRAMRQLDNVRLLPYQPASRLKEVMESGDVHLISMKEEAAGFIVPSKLYAALAVKRPCIFIGPGQSETAKVIHDFHAGDIIAQGDSEALAEAIKRYRLDADQWFAAQSGAASAGEVFVPKESIKAWIKRAWAVVEQDMDAGDFREAA